MAPRVVEGPAEAAVSGGSHEARLQRHCALYVRASQAYADGVLVALGRADAGGVGVRSAAGVPADVPAGGSQEAASGDGPGGNGPGGDGPGGEDGEAELLLLDRDLVAARDGLFRFLMHTGWQPPADVLATLTVDEHVHGDLLAVLPADLRAGLLGTGRGGA